MGIEEISESVMHLGYLFFARDNNIKRTEKIEERYETNAVEPIAETSWLGKNVDFYV